MKHLLISCLVVLSAANLYASELNCTLTNLIHEGMLEGDISMDKNPDLKIETQGSILKKLTIGENVFKGTDFDMLSTSVNKNSETVYNVEQISESYGGPFEIEVTLAAATAGPEGAIIQKALVTHYVEGDQNRLLFAEYLCKQ